MTGLMAQVGRIAALRQVCAVVAALLTLGAPGCPPGPAVIDGGAYRIEIVRSDAGTEYRCIAVTAEGAHQFLSVVLRAGAIAVRPHPGLDVNGWGSTLYPQPFFAGADLALGGLAGVNADADGVYFQFAGRVPDGAGNGHGAWTCDLAFACDRAAKTVTGAGDYAISLDAELSSATGDLNLYRLASNYLLDVPLLGGGTGDTGDMSHAEVRGDALDFDWLPPAQPAHFPGETGTALSINAVGAHNVVDTAAQGHEPIAAAYKPSLRIGLSGDAPVLTFGAIYDLALAQDFWEDNVGITPLIRAGSPGTVFRFDVTFESTTPEPEDL